MRRLKSAAPTQPNILRPRFLLTAAAAVVLLGMGCGESTAPPEPVVSVTVSPATALVVPGGTEVITASPKGASGKELTGREALWASSDNSVVTVAGGILTGVAKGNASVTVSVEGITASVPVEVREGGVITAAGAAFSALDGAVSVAAPAGAVTANLNIAVRPAVSAPPARRLLPGTAFDFAPDGRTFQQPVTISIRYDPGSLTSESPQGGLRLYEAVQGAWRAVPGSTVDQTAKVVSAPVSHLSTYGVLMQPIVDTVRLVSPPTSVAVKTGFQALAIVKDSAGETLTRPIKWSTSAPAVLQIDSASGAATALTPGNVTITAASEGKSGSATISVVPGPPAHMLRVTAETVDGAAGRALASPPAVRVTDEYGNGISGFTVVFTVTAGGGSVVGGTAATSINGYASPSSWTLGTVAGPNTVTATAAGLPESPIVFNAIGNPGAASTIVASAPTALTGTAGGLVAPAPAVKVTDAFGNAVPGISVSFAPASGSGSVTGGNATTASTGVAAVSEWRLGVTPGTQTLAATLSGASGSPVVFTATAIAPVPANIAITAGNGQTAVTLSAVPTRPAVRVTDVAGIPVPGLRVTFAVTGGGGALAGEAAVTGADGVATVGSWTMGSTPGTNTISASAGGLAAVTFTATAVAPTPAIVSLFEGQNQTASAGSPVPVRPAVRVTDAQGRPVPGYTVSFRITRGAGSLTGASAVTNTSGIATVGNWILAMGPNSLAADAAGLSGSPVIFVATGVPYIQIVTFGDSNTDYGYAGTSPPPLATSYVSNTQPRPSASAPNSPYQLAGKIEAKWYAVRSESIRVVNHGIASTRTGEGRTYLGSPNALQVVNGFTRFEGEVLARGYPWSGGESRNSAFPDGAILRVNAFVPRTTDYVYVSLGTNDLNEGVSTDSIAENIGKMVDMWVIAGLPVNHFIVTTVPPRDGSPGSAYIPGLNVAIRRLASDRGLRLIDLAKYTSNDGGLTWKSDSLHIDGDLLHYSEEVRDFLADEVLKIINVP